MSRYLVLLNDRIGEGPVPPELRRLNRGDTALRLLAPIGPPPAGLSGLAEALDRLQGAISTLRQAGFEVSGRIETIADPVAAVERAVGADPYDGVVVLGDRPRIARWLGLDLVSRIDRRVDPPVVAAGIEQDPPAPDRSPDGRLPASARTDTDRREDASGDPGCHSVDGPERARTRARVTEARRHLDRSWHPQVDRYQLERELMERFGFDGREAGFLLAERSAAARIEAHGLSGNGDELEAIVDELILPLAGGGSGWTAAGPGAAAAPLSGQPEVLEQARDPEDPLDRR